MDEWWVQRGKLESFPQAQWGNSLRRKPIRPDVNSASNQMRRSCVECGGCCFLFGPLAEGATPDDFRSLFAPSRAQKIRHLEAWDGGCRFYGQGFPVANKTHFVN